jgi:hypothetical protein
MTLTMAERLDLRRALGRWPLLGALPALFFAAVLAVAPPMASATSRAAASKDPLPIPGAFRLAGSNGYTLYVLGLESREGHPGSVLIFAFAKGKGVSYRAPATVTETAIQADLGEVGEISVSFQRSNHATSVPCGKRTIRFDSGLYEGKIVFHGEEGYTSAEETSVPGNIDYFISGVCGDGVISETFVGGGPSRRPPGAALYVRNPGLGPELRVTKTRAGAAAWIEAGTREFTNGISIERYATLRVPSGAFKYDRRLRTATLRPPAPFAGSAHFDLGKKAGQRWSGSLVVDLPGRAGLPLTGPSLRATLSPYRSRLGSRPAGAQVSAGSLTSVSRMLLPEGSRKPESMP